MIQLSIAHNCRRNPLYVNFLVHFKITWSSPVSNMYWDGVAGKKVLAPVRLWRAAHRWWLRRWWSACPSAPSAPRRQTGLKTGCPTSAPQKETEDGSDYCSLNVRLVFLCVNTSKSIADEQEGGVCFLCFIYNVGQPYMSVLPHAPLGSEWAGAGCECATSSSPRPSRCHSYPSECSTPWGEASENIMRNLRLKDERGRGRRRSSQLPVSFSSECDTALLGGVTEHSAV